MSPIDKSFKSAKFGFACFLIIGLGTQVLMTTWLTGFTPDANIKSIAGATSIGFAVLGGLWGLMLPMFWEWVKSDSE